MTFNGFISYSHAADGRLAPAVQRGLHQLARPWHRRRALWIFRDQTGLSVTPKLWSSIEDALNSSEFFVLLASPTAARSPWVGREIEHWIATKSADRILPVVTDGHWAWDSDRNDFTEKSDAVPPALRGVFTEEPLYLDLRWARGSEQLNLRHSRFRDAIAQLAAPMHGLSKDELEGEDVRLHRRTRRLRSAAAAGLMVMALAATSAGAAAVSNANRARDAAAEALSQRLEADGQRASAARERSEAARQQGLAQEAKALAREQEASARKQRARALRAAEQAEEAQRTTREQQRLAAVASGEARRQQGLTELAVERTREQERLAQEAAEQARQERAEAERLAKVADTQRRAAAQAEAEADKQQARAEREELRAVSLRLRSQASAKLADDPRTALKLMAAVQKLTPNASAKRWGAGMVASTHFAGSLSAVNNMTSGPGGLLAVSGSDGRVSLWDAHHLPDPVRYSSVPVDRSGIVWDLALSPDGRTLAVVAGNETTLWDVTRRRRPVRGGVLVNPWNSDDRVTEVALGGKSTIAAAVHESGMVTVWDVAAPLRPTWLTTLNGSWINGLTMSRDGATLHVQPSGGGPGEFVDLVDPKKPVFLSVNDGQVGRPTALSPDGALVAVGRDDGTVRVTGRPRPPGVPQDVDPDVYLSGLTAGAVSVTFSPDGRTVAATDSTGMVMVWSLQDLTAGLVLASFPAHRPITSLTFDQDGTRLIGLDGSVVRFWNVSPSGTPHRSATLDGSSGRTVATTFLPGGRRLMLADADGTAQVWTVKDRGRPVRGADVRLHDREVRQLEFSPGGRRLAVVDADDGTVSVATVADPARATRLSPALVGDGSLLDFAPDGRFLGILVAGGRIEVWDVQNTRRPSRVSSLPAATSGFAVAPGGRFVAVRQDLGIELWDMTGRATPRRVATFTGHNGWITSVRFSPDGRYLASSSTDGTAMLWDVVDPSRPGPLATLPVGDTGLGVTFSPDGSTLTTATSGPTMPLWDVANPVDAQRVAAVRFRSVVDGPGTIFSPDGGLLATTGPEFGTVSLWNLADLQNLLKDPGPSGCAVAGTGLTEREWARYIPELPYRSTCPGRK